MPENSQYRGFSKRYDKPARKLITTIGILPLGSSDESFRKTPVQVRALWDTGATLSAIKPTLTDRLKLRVASGSSKTIAGVGGSVKANFTLVSIFLTPNLSFEFCPIYVLGFPVDVDMIIGMDIIGKGDFAISHGEGKTLFSFVAPPLPKGIALTEKAEKANRQEK